MNMTSRKGRKERKQRIQS